ncbi:MAG: FecR domain-containing protein [Gammaproteobacteria bacterium]|nr:FecR domain-containing protein [Gammaproteobacteria bacterium]
MSTSYCPPQNAATRKRGLLGFCLLAGLLLTAHARAETTDWIYTVRSGDTLIGISNNYLVQPRNWVKLQKINRVANPHRMPPGMALRIPVEWLKRRMLTAEVVRVQGSAEVVPAQGSEPLAVETGRMLNNGDRIRTGANSNLTLRFADGSRLMVMENSRLTLETMTAYGQSGVTNTRARLESGQIETQVTPRKGPAARYEVITPAIAIGVRGTDFRVSADEHIKTSRSEVLEGAVAAEAAGARLAVPAGFGTLAEAGKPPIPPKALLKAPDLSGTATLLQRLPLRFKWTALEGAAAYRAQVFADPDFQNLLLDGAFKNNEAKWADLPDGHYFLRVRATDEQGLEGLNAGHAFRLKARPEPPFLSVPADKGKVYGDTAQFQWSASSQASTYHFQLAADEGFTRLADDTPGLKDIQHAATRLTPGEYYWRVASRTASGDEGPFSDTQSFTMKAIPPPPGAATTKVGDKDIEFQWPAGEAGQTYQFQLARDKDFNTIHADQTLAEPRITLPKPAAGDYFMRVRTIDADGFAGPFGAVQQFNVPRNIPWWLIIPVLLFPLAP